MEIDYRSRYADNLGKELPRIPAVKTLADFRAFSQAGRDLAHWHLNYETVEMYGAVLLDTPEGERTVAAVCNRQANSNEGAGRLQSAATFRVTKMKFAKRKDTETGKSVNYKTTVIYSGITNDANLWATETMGNPRTVRHACC